MQDCKVCQHTLWQATHDVAVAELQHRRAIGNSGSGSALRQLATKAHGKPHSRVVPSNMAEQSMVTTTIIINSYKVPHLDEHPGLKCCVATCTVNLDDCWHYHKDQHDDRRHVCNRCMVQWPDLIQFFSLKHDPTFDTGLPVKLRATIVQQAACRSFLARVRWHKAKAAAALLQSCQCRHAAQALLWQLFDAAQCMVAATLLQMWQCKQVAQLLLRRFNTR